MVVVDEAHRAQGSYAYVSVVTHLAGKHKYFRVLALSATPGNDVAAVQDVIIMIDKNFLLMNFLNFVVLKLKIGHQEPVNFSRRASIRNIS